MKIDSYFIINSKNLNLCFYKNHYNFFISLSLVIHFPKGKNLGTLLTYYAHTSSIPL